MKLTKEEIEAGIKIIKIPTENLENLDTTDRNIEKMARGYILGHTSKIKRREVKDELEAKVVKRIGSRGKWLVDKLFELIEGVSIVEKNGPQGIRHYTVPPNLNAIIYALDRVLGKPVTKVESHEVKKGIMVVENIIRNLADVEK